MKSCAFFLFYLSVLIYPCAHSMPARPDPFNMITPDGRSITLVGHGDECNNWLTDTEGYLVLKQSGEFVYADENMYGKIYPSQAKVGIVDPKTKGTKKGLVIKKSPEEVAKTVCGVDKAAPKPPKDGVDKAVPPPPKGGPPCQGENCRNRGLRRRTAAADSLRGKRRRTTATTGTLKNLVLLLEFNDNTKALPSVEDIDVFMNSDYPDPVICPTGSLKGIYREMSQGQLTINSTVTPWIKLSQNEKYYSGGFSPMMNLQDGIREALDYIQDNGIIDFNNHDDDNDGFLDSITILHSGYGAEFLGADCYGNPADDRVWSHKFELAYDNAGSSVGPWLSTGGVTVQKYFITSALWETCGSDIGRIAAVAHEAAHFLGLRDQYDLDGGGKGLGGWDMMGSAWGFDNNQLLPGHISAYGKIKLGWIEPQTPVEGVNVIAEVQASDSSVPKVYKIGDGEFGFPEGEYLLIENRQKKGVDLILPTTGLAIYHVDELAELSTEGHPGQSGWPGNGKHYRVALLQADGFYGLEKASDKGSSGDLFPGAFGRTSLMPSDGDPADGPFPNTDSYQGGVLKKTGVEITQISGSGDIMTFHFRYTGDSGSSSTSLNLRGDSTNSSQYPVPLSSQVPSEMPSDMPSDMPSLSPSEVPTASPTVTPFVSPTTDRAAGLTALPAITSPTATPMVSPTATPAAGSQTAVPTNMSPTATPLVSQTATPAADGQSAIPTTTSLTVTPTVSPMATPSNGPSTGSSDSPTEERNGVGWRFKHDGQIPTNTSPTATPMVSPTVTPAAVDSQIVVPMSKSPTVTPSVSPTATPVNSPTVSPTEKERNGVGWRFKDW